MPIDGGESAAEEHASRRSRPDRGPVEAGSSAAARPLPAPARRPRAHHGSDRRAFARGRGRPQVEGRHPARPRRRPYSRAGDDPRDRGAVVGDPDQHRQLDREATFASHEKAGPPPGRDAPDADCGGSGPAVSNSSASIARRRTLGRSKTTWSGSGGRRMRKTPKTPITIVEAVDDPDLLGATFPGRKTWRRWRVFLKSTFGHRLTPTERAVFEHHTERDVPQTACKAIGRAGRIVHDLRRSGVKHLIDAGIDPHTAMAFSGHRTPSMLRRYHIIDVDDLRRAAERAQAYTRPGTTVTVLRDGTATPQPP